MPDDRVEATELDEREIGIPPVVPFVRGNDRSERRPLESVAALLCTSTVTTQNTACLRELNFAFKSKTEPLREFRIWIVMPITYKTVSLSVTEVILFTQETCGACATQRQKNEGIEDEFPDVEFRDVDIQKDLETAEEYDVRKTPTTLIYADGERVDEFIGIVEREELEEEIRSAIHRQEGLAQRLIGLVHR